MVSNISIIGCLFLEIGSHQSMFSRPYQSNVDYNTMEQLAATTNDFRTVNASTIAGVAGGIIKPNAAPGAQLGISNGWSGRRFAFMMKVQIGSPLMGGSTIQVLTGWTDLPLADQNFSLTQTHIDPRMVLYFNNTVTMRAITRPTAHGPATIMTMADSSHLLSSHLASQIIVPQGNLPQNYQGFGVPTTAQLNSLRPEDLMGHLSLPGLMSSSTGVITDTRSMMNPTELKKSRRSNGLAPDYLARSINAVQGAARDTDDKNHGGGVDTFDFYEAARVKVREPIMPQDSFMSHLREYSQTFKFDHSVTFGELEVMFPGLQNLAHVVWQGNVQNNTAPNPLDCASFGETGIEVQMASVLMSSVPALMMDSTLTGIDLHATNETLDGSIAFRIENPLSFCGDGVDLTGQLQRFHERFLTEVFRDITNNNLIGVQLKMHVRIAGETFISIRAAGGYERQYAVPSFCDGLFTPVLSFDHKTLGILASDINNMAQNAPIR